ncbi:hypothetical protein BJ165DRAFT_659764 [Panaeolus papilionaceus]|nr:hypothetical protein BJ165DRAFT_659764 [Panaeolus papilionaceus]
MPRAPVVARSVHCAVGLSRARAGLANVIFFASSHHHQLTENQSFSNYHHHKTMTGRGKGSKGLGVKTTTRHRRISRCSNAIVEVRNPSIRRLGRRGGVKRLEGSMCVESKAAMGYRLRDVVRDAIAYTEYENRRTISAQDVVRALQRSGIKLYGFND